MQLDLGTRIRHFRRRDGRTQEALAEALGVTSQAVSRWESGGSFPDMNLIPSLANYFDITIDELFGYTNDRAKKIDMLVSTISDMRWRNNGVDNNITECITFARNALVEFPGNEKLMVSLASLLYTAGYVRYGEFHLTDEDGYSVYDRQRHQGYSEWKEAIRIYEKALETLENGKIRDQVVDELSQLYLNMGEHEKGSALANAAPSIWNAREFLRAYAFDGRDGVQALSETLLTTIRACAQFVLNITTGYQQHLSPAEKADCLRRAISLFELICPDGNYGTHHGYVASLQMLLSLYLWLDGQQDKAFAALDDALENQQKMEIACTQETIRYSAPLVRLAEEKVNCTAEQVHADLLSMPEDWPWWNVPEAKLVKSEMQADPRWDVWVDKVKK